MKCPVCGKGIKATDEFCDNCGAVLKGTLVSTPAAKSPSRAVSANLARGNGVAQAKFALIARLPIAPRKNFVSIVELIWMRHLR